MNQLWKLAFILLVTNQARGEWLEEIEQSLGAVKNAAERKVEELKGAIAKASEEGEMAKRSALVKAEEDIDREVAKAATALVSAPKQCVQEKHIQALTGARKSLWKCPQLARVVSDGVDIGREGVQLTSEIMGTLDDFLQSLTACVVGPAQSAWNKAACYLGTIGTLGSGIASNIQQVEFYVTVVKRDVADMKAATKLCVSPAGPVKSEINHALNDINACKNKIK